MKYFILFLLVIGSTASFARTYELTSSMLTFKVRHPFKSFEGVATQTKGKAICNGNNCEILTALKLELMSTGNTNRDLNMYRILKIKKFPLVVVKLNQKIDESKILLSVDLNGKNKLIESKVSDFKIDDENMNLNLNFTILLSDFEIERPSLLTFAIEDKIEINVKSLWKNRGL